MHVQDAPFDLSHYRKTLFTWFWLCVYGFLFYFEVLPSCDACCFSFPPIVWFSLLFSCSPHQCAFSPCLLCISLFSFSLQSLQLFAFVLVLLSVRPVLPSCISHLFTVFYCLPVVCFLFFVPVCFCSSFVIKVLHFLVLLVSLFFLD